MRTALALPLLLLTGCGVGGAPPPKDMIACAPRGEPLKPVCTLSRSGNTLIVRQVDGAFRRLVRTSGNVESADGVEVAVQNGPDVTIGGWTFRLPQDGR